MDAERYVKSRLASGALTHEQIVNLVRAFQTQNDLEVDGKPGPITLSRVDEVLLDRPTPIVEETEEEELPNLAIAPSDWIFGIDIDHHQRLQPDALDLDLVGFCYVGVSEGTSGRTSVDPKFPDHVRDLSGVGTPIGPYHFGRPSSTIRFGPQFGQPAGEAENFARQWDVAQKIAGRLLPPVLDMEDEKEFLTSRELIDWTLAWCERCTELIGREPIIYTYFSFIHTELKGYIDDLTRHRLWLADYRDTPREIPGWPWLIRQFTGSGTVRGVTPKCDRNVFRGTRAQLEGLLA